MAQDTLLGFPAHTLPYRRGKLTTLSTVSRAAGNPAALLLQPGFRWDSPAFASPFLPLFWHPENFFSCRFIPATCIFSIIFMSDPKKFHYTQLKITVLCIKSGTFICFIVLIRSLPTCIFTVPIDLMQASHLPRSFMYSKNTD